MQIIYQNYKANYFIRRYMLATNNSLVILLDKKHKLNDHTDYSLCQQHFILQLPQN